MDTQPELSLNARNLYSQIVHIISTVAAAVMVVFNHCVLSALLSLVADLERSADT
jgi:hypothetical protein